MIQLLPGGSPSVVRATLASLLAVSGAFLPVGALAQDDADDSILVLSPFEVSTAKDSGYYASNAISGTRVNALIEDIPLSIEVITSEFIDDTGATDLRDSLRYSAGIVLQSQNDALNNQMFSDVGGVNNPEGVTNNKSQTSFKMRGFVTDNVLRNGFRRQHATDSINIDRVEVVRGPSALLYGIGNFGGVINYVTKQPLNVQAYDLSMAMGSNGLYRFTADATGPIAETMDVNYRVTFAAEQADDWTDLKSSQHYFVSPIVTFRPFQNTKVTLDVEYGEQHDEGISFQSVRTPTISDIPVTQPDRMETYGFLQFEGQDPRTFRWSGPDTYQDTKAFNAFAQIQQQLAEGLDVLIGYNYNQTEWETRDVFGGLVVGQGPSALRATIQARQIVDGKTSDEYAELDKVILQYNWNDSLETSTRHQARAELNYNLQIPMDNEWLSTEHNFLLGYSHEASKREYDSLNSEFWNWKSPTDSTYIRFDVQGNGQPSSALVPNTWEWSEAQNSGRYFVYSGRFLQERLFIIAGLRRDVNSVDTSSANLRYDTPPFAINESPAIGTNSAQYGVSFEAIKGFTAFALMSEGVNPNFNGAIDGYGQALKAATAKSKEVGVKLDLFDNMISATISAFKIERTGVPSSYWWGPYPAWGQFRASDDIVYRLDDFNPDLKSDNPYLTAALSEWNAAKAAGAVFDAVNPMDDLSYTYLNASTPEGAAFLDSVFQALYTEFAKPRDEAGRDNDPWPGWLYAGTDPGADPNVNTSAEDWAAHGASQSISDSSKGWEAQILFTPNENIQMLVNYSNTTRQVDNPGNFAAYPYDPNNWDRWATWYFPNQAWGLSGFPAEEVYPGGDAGMPSTDTSTWKGLGYGQGESLDDTPKHVVSTWGTYRFTEGFLEGLQIGLGGIWESKREYASGFTTTGQKKLSAEKVQAWTDPRLTVNAMMKYSRTFSEKYDFWTQLNVDNVLDDQDQYGLLYAPGMSWMLQVGVSF